MDPRLHLFGIRHHGPGSAHALEQALEALDPAVILIEGPPEADAVLPLASQEAMRPPVAILAYAEHDSRLASFFPLAEYSPEWRAILWAHARQRPVRFIDLPAAHKLAPVEATASDEKDEAESEALDETDDAGHSGREKAKALRRDPLAALAFAAGYSDSEAWWNDWVEQRSGDGGLFAEIADAMTALREDAESNPDRLEPEREAHMRLAVRQALKETDGPVAVVTGAWHVPALREDTPAAQDRALLKGLPKVKVQTTWVPWTDTRLAAASGYGAGVVSPGWYRHLWQALRRETSSEGLDSEAAGARWQSQVAQLLRDEGQIAATASVIEATRLAQALAALRGLAVPGLPEMRDASLSVLCEGEAAPLRLIEARLVIGTRVGEIDAALPQVPLQADLTRLQKTLRLKPEALESEISLDLRSEAGLSKSILLNRLRLIGVPWGEPIDPGGSRGTFRERWRLAWEPEFSVKLVEAMVWGTTVETASGAAAAAQAEAAERIGALAELVKTCLFADLADPAEFCIARLQERAAQSGEVALLMETVEPLVAILRYGTARRVPTQALTLLVTTLAREVCVGLVYGCRQLDDEAAGRMAERMSGFDRALSLFEDEDITADWTAALHRLQDDGQANARLKGLATKLLFDRGRLDAAEAGAAMTRALSAAVPAKEAGAWLEGFFTEAGTLLLLDAGLRSTVDEWLMRLPSDQFEELLPLLRRVTGSFDASERRRLLAVVRDGKDAAAGAAPSATSPVFAEALPLLRTILGVRA